jgi:hypothetical protein
MVSRAEVLVPGISIPTFDAKSTARITADSMCQFRRRVLSEAWKGDAKDAIEPLLDGEKPVFHDKAMTCDRISTLFNAASTLRSRTTTAAYRPKSGAAAQSGVQRVMTAAEINARNREVYGPKH